MIESERVHHQPVELAHLGVIAAEQFEETCLRAGGALDASEWQRRDASVDFREIEHDVLHPERRTLSNGH